MLPSMSYVKLFLLQLSMISIKKPVRQQHFCENSMTLRMARAIERCRRPMKRLIKK